MLKHLKKSKIYLILFPSLICFVCLVGYIILNLPTRPAKTIRELAYDINPKRGYTVYVEEGDTYVPYYVLTADYGGHVLLLHKDLLEETRQYKESPHGPYMWAGEYGAYYEESDIDEYLNGEFLDTLGQSVKDAMVMSDIVITDKSSLGVTGETATTIQRRVFLLSLAELGVKDSYIAVTEGKPLRYFKDGDHSRRVGSFPNGKKCPYWTRTPNTWNTCFVSTIGVSVIADGTADGSSGIRPAFCLESSTPLVQRENIVAGETVYTIK